MNTVNEAFEIIQRHLPRSEKISGDLEDLLGHTTAGPLIADREYPALDRSTMDGIGVSFQTYSQGARTFPVVGACHAGGEQTRLTDLSQCFEVMTGAPLPMGADLIIPYEHLEIKNGVAKVIERERTRFENVHRRASDFVDKALLLESGSRLNGPHAGIAASVGYSRISCVRPLKIKVISTGDELVAITEHPLAHQIRRSNSLALKAMLRDYGFNDVDVDHLPDDPDVLSEHFLENTPRYDVLIYSGGVSVGKRDYLPEVWLKCGVEKYIHGVSQKPGKPMWFGVDQKNHTAVFGLPGNPVSCLVCLRRYFLPARPIFARLDKEIFFDKDLTYFAPVKLRFAEDGVMWASPALAKSSGEFAALAATDGFVELPRERSRFNVGESFRFFPWGGLM